MTDCARAETLLRLVQSVPSPKAEPIKLWLAKVRYERMQELADPSLSIDRAREVYKKQGRSEKWIAQRMTGQETRNKLTDYWSANDVKPGQEFAILTNLIHQEWSEVSRLRSFPAPLPFFLSFPQGICFSLPPTRKPPAPAARSPNALALNWRR